MKLTVQELASPRCRLPIINNPTVFLPRQRLLAAVNFSNDGRDTRLFLVDADTLESEALSVPDAQFGAYGMAAGADGLLYLGFFGGRIYAFDPDQRSFRKVADPFPNSNKLTWGGCATRAGCIYMGVYPNGAFTEYNPADGSHRIIHPLAEDTKGAYAQDFVELPDGRLLLILKGSHPAVVIYDPASGTLCSHLKIRRNTVEINRAPHSLALLDERHVIYSGANALHTFDFIDLCWKKDYLENPGHPLSWLTRQGDGFLAVGKDGALLRISRTQCVQLDCGMEGGNRVTGGVHAIGNNRYLCLGDNGQISRFSIDCGVEATGQLDNVTENGLNLHTLHKDPSSDHVVGSHFINSQIFRLDIRTGEVEPSLRKVVAGGGQITCATFIDNVAYLGFYGGAAVLRYDPRQPITIGENPRLIVRAGEEQNRPIAIESDGRLLYLATRAAYEKLGGAICVVDPHSGGCTVHRNFVPQQNPVSFFHRGDGFFAGTTQIYGDQGSCLPQAKAAVAWLWDARTREVVHTCCPWQADGLSALDLSPAGRLIGFEDSRYYIYDTHAREHCVRDWHHPMPQSGLYIDAHRFLAVVSAAAPGKCRLLLLDDQADSVIDLGEHAALRLFQKTGEHTILAGIDGSRVGLLNLVR